MDRRLHLLWITPYLPERGISAAQERWWNLLARLAQRHHVTLLTFIEAGATGDSLPPGLAAVHRIVRRPSAPEDPLALLPSDVRWGFAHPAYRAAVAERLAAQRFDLVQYECIETAAIAPRPTLPTILTVHQIGFASRRALWRAQGRGLRRGAVEFYRYLRDLDWELRALARAHHVITMSEEDAARLRRFAPALRLSVSPLGVDCQQFRPQSSPLPEVDLVFVGNFRHLPNRDAVRWLVTDLLPRLDSRVRVRIIGRALPVDIADDGRSERIEVVGAVDDVRPHLAAARVVVAPVRFGTGMRGKVLEALAMGRPVVTTHVGAEGLGATGGVDLLVADDAGGFTAAVQRVLTDTTLAERLGAGGRRLAETRFDWDRIAQAHDDIYAQVLREAGTPPRLPADRSAVLAKLASVLPGRSHVALGAILLLRRAVRWYLAGSGLSHSPFSSGGAMPQGVERVR